MAQAKELRVGNVIDWNGKPFTIKEIVHIQPGRLKPYFQIEMQSMNHSQKLKLRFNADDQFDVVYVKEEDGIFSYQNDEDYIFYDNEKNGYQEIILKEDQIKTPKLLSENCRVIFKKTDLYGILEAKLPQSIICEVLNNELHSSCQILTIMNGVKIEGPTFIKKGDKIKINTETMTYMNKE